VQRLQARGAELEAEVKASRSLSAKDVADSLAQRAVRKGDIAVVAEVVDVHDVEQLLALVDKVRDCLTPAVVVLAASVDNKGVLIVSVTAGTAVVHAGEVVKATAGLFGGRGGGNAGLGRAGGIDPSALRDAVAKAKDLVWAVL
jgi:alanyl-tRNA synthetase